MKKEAIENLEGYGGFTSSCIEEVIPSDDDIIKLTFKEFNYV